jgi:hypothetical protein
MGGARLLATAVVVGALGLLAGGPPAAAQGLATQTWVSGAGDDANTCDRDAPCKTFSGAIAKTAAGGEIDVLDPGGFGAVTISKAITIDGSGTFASVQGSVTNAINVVAGGNDVVILRGLSIQATTGVTGIRFGSGKALIIENTSINGFSGHGIDVALTGSGDLVVSNSDIRNNGGTGIRVASTGGSALAVVSGSQLVNNAIGIDARSNSRVAVRDTLVSSNAPVSNTSIGLQAQPDTGTAELNADNVMISLTGTGVQVGGTGNTATARLSNLQIFNNTVGVSIGSNGSALSFGDNRIAGNGSGNSPPLTPIPLQ